MDCSLYTNILTKPSLCWSLADSVWVLIPALILVGWMMLSSHKRDKELNRKLRGIFEQPVEETLNIPITVNAKGHIWRRPTISCMELIKLAYGEDAYLGGKNLTVSFAKGLEPRASGCMNALERVQVVKGMVFNVVDTSNA